VDPGATWSEEGKRLLTLEEQLTAEIPRLRGFLRRLEGRPAPDVDDLVQESLTRALRYRETFDARRAIWPWLKRTAFRVFLDQRDRDRVHPSSGEELVEELPAWDVDRAAQREQVHRLLDALAPLERDVLLRFHRDGLSVAAISGELGLPEGTVKSHLHRARRRLAARGDEEVSE